MVLARGEPRSPLANGGAFGGKDASPVARAARDLADATGRTVRAVFSREDVVRLVRSAHPWPRAPSSTTDASVITGIVGGAVDAYRDATVTSPYTLAIDASWDEQRVPGPAVAAHDRFLLADHTVLVEAAFDAAGLDRLLLVRDARVAAVVLDTCAESAGGALAGARVHLDSNGAIERVDVRVAAGDPLDDVVLRSYVIGATHMALGWVLTEAITVDPETGEVFDLTIRSFGVIRARSMPPIDVTIIDDAGPPLAAFLGCRVRRRCGRHVERDHRARGGTSRAVSRPRHPCRTRATTLRLTRRTAPCAASARSRSGSTARTRGA